MITPKKITSIIHDIALLNTLGIKIVLTYGTRPQIEAGLKKDNITTDIIKGKRLTSPEALESIKAISGRYRFELEALFSNGLPNTPMHGSNIRTVSGNFITAKPAGIVNGHDHQFTGEVRKVNIDSINNALEDDNIILLSNIGYSPTGECFNLSSEDVAASTAAALNADKLIVVSDNESINGATKRITS